MKLQKNYAYSESGTAIANVENLTLNIYKPESHKSTSEQPREYTEYEDVSGASETALRKTEESSDLCHFIRPSVVDDAERLKIHKEVVNLVRNNTMPNICEYLNLMVAEKKIILPIEPRVALAELQRLGMPGEDTEGFGSKNFSKYYRK